MKRYMKMLAAALAVISLTACGNDAIDDMEGTYSDMTICNTTTASVQNTTKLGKGIKSLNVDFANAGTTFSVGFRSSEWILQDGTYTIASDIASGKCTATVNGTQMTGGDADVNIIDGKYYVSALFTDAGGKRYKLDYKGTMEFAVGVDDPEPSGYTMAIQTSAVSAYDWSTGQTTVYEGVSKYSLTVTSPTGAPSLYLDLVNAENIATPSLAGTYTVQGSSHEPWYCDNGWTYPAYGMAGGSYYVDASGTVQYITSGQITVTTATATDGTTLYSISASGLGTTTADGNTVTTSGSFNVKFISCK